MNNDGLMSPTKMQIHNANVVLKLIRDEGPISRADIARRIGSSKSTISGIITLLDQYGFVEEAGQGSPQTGRKSRLLKFNPRAYYFISVDLRWKQTVVALVDLDGNVMDQLSQSNDATSAEHLITVMVSNINKLITRHKIPNSRLEGIGVMVPGIVNVESGTVLFSGPLDWREEIELKTELAHHFNIPISIENDANALALGESWIGVGKDHSQIAYIYTEGGFGGSYIRNKEIVQGTDYTAAEFGKFMILNNGEYCSVESRLSIPGLLASRRPEIVVEDQDYDSLLKTIRDILDIETHGWSRETEEIVTTLSQLVTNVMLVLNPDVLIINSAYLCESRTFMERLEKQVREMLPDFPKRTVNILSGELTGKEEVIGGAAVALSNSRFNTILLSRQNIP